MRRTGWGRPRADRPADPRDRGTPVDASADLLLVVAVTGGPGGVLVALVLVAVGGWVAGRASTGAERRRLRWQADHDPLTGVLNRGGFHAAAAAVMDTAPRAATGVVALMVDLEDFKAVNDVHGHVAGDYVLVQAAMILQRRVADLGGVVGRVGGDEFAVLLPGVGAADVAEVVASVARLLTRTYRVRGTVADLLVHVGASVGASRGARPCGLDQLLREADSGMYAAKRGRGGWCVHGAEPGGGRESGPAAVRLLGRAG